MTHARLDTLARLRGAMNRLEAGATVAGSQQIALGHPGADLALQGGLKRGALHEIHDDDGWQRGAVAGFALGVARRLTLQRGFVLWIRQDLAVRETGELSMNGFAELGFDPGRIVVVRAQNAEVALRVMADGLGCNALGAVVSEVWGDPRVLDLAASRKLTLAARASGVTGLMLRLNAPQRASAAETRWIVRAAHSPPGPDGMAWGEPVFDAELVRNRHGPTGRWIMNWVCDESRFNEPTAYSQPAAAAAADRPNPPDQAGVRIRSTCAARPARPRIHAGKQAG